jgi:hypothetical protein
MSLDVALRKQSLALGATRPSCLSRQDMSEAPGHADVGFNLNGTHCMGGFLLGGCTQRQYLQGPCL